jgi:ABC-type glutathione transport system ATPase component
LLRVQGLQVRFGSEPPVVDGLSFELGAGESLGLVGASGSGKSLSALALMGLLPPRASVSGGEARFEGQDIFKLSAEARRRLRGGGMGLVFQEPFSALNPLMRVGRQIEEALELHQGLRGAAAAREAAAWLERVGILPGDDRAAQYPHQYSGGMRQRALLAMALAGRPRLLICDEPTTALDATVQAQMLALIKRLQAELGFALIIISHDLAVIHALAPRALVLEAGRVAEQGPVADIFQAPQSQAAQRLVKAEAALSAAYEGREDA